MVQNEKVPLLNRHGHRQKRHSRDRVSVLQKYLDYNSSHLSDLGTYSRKDSSIPVEKAGLSPKGHDDIAACIEVVARNCHLGATRHWSPLRLEIRECQSL